MKPSTNNAIEAPESDYLYKGQSQIPDSGFGLFTAIAIYKDETIALFKGEILTALEAKHRAQAKVDQCFINLPDGSILDSMNVSCYAKYANDANGLTQSNFKNNARIALDDDGNVCLQAIKHIKASEELFCSYGKRYWEKMR